MIRSFVVLKKMCYSPRMNFDMQEIAFRALPILWALTVHEFANAWMAFRCGDDTAERLGRMTLNPWPHLDLFGTLAFLILGFGWAKPVPVNPRFFRNPKWDDIKVSQAGVAANLISAGFFALLFRLVIPHYPGEGGWMSSLLILLLLSVRINLILLFFNLIPIPPLDGSHVLRELLPWHVREKYQHIMGAAGIWVLVALLTLGRPLLDLLVWKPSVMLTEWLTG